MRVLLVGEYSRLHNSLKEGLTSLGHDVLLIGNGDRFKNYPVDININHSFHNRFLKKLKVAFYKLTSIDLGSLEVYLKSKRHLKRNKGFDVVQLINESPFGIRPQYEKKLIDLLIKNNKKLILLSCGIDHQCMTYMMANKFRYSIMSPYLKDKSLYKQYRFQLQYLNKAYTSLHQFIYKHCHGVIATDMDYHLPLEGRDKYLGFVPNPINIDKIHYIPLKKGGKIKIFHGINTSALHKKGNTFFSEALKIIDQKFSNKVDIKTTRDIPYKDYIKLYDECHILLDQVYSHDQGYNALEAMAKGKVVFTGAEKEWVDYFGLEEDTVAINALPDAQKIAKKIEWLVLNPNRVEDISLNARAFIEREHNYKDIATIYLRKWNDSTSNINS